MKTHAIITGNGELKILPDAEHTKFIRSIRKSGKVNEMAAEHAFLTQFLHPRFEVTSPASVGCLTSAPLVTDGKDVWGFMDYQVESFLDTLASGKAVTFQKG